VVHDADTCDLPLPRHRATHLSAFTLIEMLVVVAIVVLLVALLLPALNRVRFQARLVTCKSNLHQIGVALATYAHRGGRIPFGPEVQPLGPMLEGNDGTKATNQIWTGPQTPACQYMGVGLLLARRLVPPELLYCPGDDSTDPVEELDKIRRQAMEPVFSSYLYRQLQETNGRGMIDRLGLNSAGGRAKALALDMNSVVTLAPEWQRTNHKAIRVNVLYLDGSVLDFDNGRHTLSLRNQDLADVDARRGEIFRQADTCTAHCNP